MHLWVVVCHESRLFWGEDFRFRKTPKGRLVPSGLVASGGGTILEGRVIIRISVICHLSSMMCQLKKSLAGGSFDEEGFHLFGAVCSARFPDGLRHDDLV